MTIFNNYAIFESEEDFESYNEYYRGQRRRRIDHTYLDTELFPITEFPCYLKRCNIPNFGHGWMPISKQQFLKSLKSWKTKTMNKFEENYKYFENT